MRRKITMLFVALLSCAGVVKAQTVITDVTLLTDDMECTVTTGGRGGWAVNADKNQFGSTNDYGFGTTVNLTEEQQIFQFKTIEGKVYLYSLYAEKYVKMDRTLSETAEQAIEFIAMEGGNAGKFVVKFDNSHFINLGGSCQMVINNWGANAGGEYDAGNIVTITDVTELRQASEEYIALTELIGTADALAETVNANIGTAIGEYTQATATALNNAIATAKALNGNEVAQSHIDALQAAINSVSYILPTVGQYYQIHSALTAFAETKAVYSNGTQPGWKTLNADDESFYWLAVETADGGVAFQNAADGKYIQGHEWNAAWTMENENTNANISVKIFSKAENKNDYEYGFIVGGYQMHAMNHGGGTGAGSHLVGYDTNNANSASSWFLVPVELKKFYDVTYNFVYNEEVKFSSTTSVAEGAAYPEVVVPFLPYGVTAANVATPEGAVSEAKAFNFELTVEHELPFVAAADVNNITTWYYLQMHTNQPGYIGDIADDCSINVANGKESDGSDNYVWGFVGNVFDGITVVNKGTGKQLTSAGSGNVAVAEAGTAFFVAATTETSENATYGFCLRNSNSTNYVNANYTAGKLSHWGSTDAGSTFFATECDKEYAVEVSAVGYSTYYSLYRLIIPETVKAYVVAETNEGAAVLQQVTGVLPARTGVILEGEGTHTFVTIDAPAAAIESNKLQGSIVAKEVTVAENKAAYILGNGTKGVGLYKAMLTDGKFTNNANKAYMILDVEAAAGAAMFSFGRGEGTTGIDNSQFTIDNVVIYDLTGRRVETMEKGIYIVNGKKVIR